MQSDYWARTRTRALQTVLIALVIVSGWNHAHTLVAAHAAARSKDQGWEYKTVVKALSYKEALLGGSEVKGAKCYDGSTEVKCDTMLDSLGTQGWDLTSAFPNRQQEAIRGGQVSPLQKSLFLSERRNNGEETGVSSLAASESAYRKEFRRRLAEKGRIRTNVYIIQIAHGNAQLVS